MYMSSAVQGQVLSPDELAEKARVELNETDETRTAGLEELRRLIEQAKEKEELSGLSAGKIAVKYNRCDDDSFLLRFLRARKFKVEDAMKTLQNFLSLRQRRPDLFEDHPDAVRKIFSTGALGVLPKRHPSGAVILVIYAGKFDFANNKFEDQMRASVFSSELMMQSVETQVCGMIIVESLHGFNLFSAMRQNPSNNQMSMDWMQNCMPARLKAMHIIEPPIFIRMLFGLVQPFMKQKMKERISVYGPKTQDRLYKNVPKQVLPTEFGGEIEFDPLAWLHHYGLLEDPADK